MYYGGELNVPGAPGNNWVGSSMPVIPIGYGGQQGLISHHMNPNVDAQGNVTVEGLGQARENQFNKTGQPIGTGWGEPSGAELQQIIERMKLEGQNQSNNIPAAMPQSTFQVGNMNPLIAQAPAGQQTQAQNLLNPLDWFSGRNQQTADEVKEGTYKGGKGGGIDKMIRRTSDLNNLINQM